MAEKVKPEALAGYQRSAGELYDLIYGRKDYASEAKKIAALIKDRCRSGGNKVLEAACGTGSYMKLLAEGDYSVDGFDLSAEQVTSAKKKMPDARIVQADMLDFDMGEAYDAVICLFSSIGYVKTTENLDKAVANMAKHLKPGGVIIIEPWLKPEVYREGHVSLENNSSDDMTVARMGFSKKEGDVSIMDMHHMVGTSSGIEHFVETHELGLFSDDDFRASFAKSGLEIEIDPEGLTGRGLYIGVKPL